MLAIGFSKSAMPTITTPNELIQTTTNNEINSNPISHKQLIKNHVKNMPDSWYQSIKNTNGFINHLTSLIKESQEHEWIPARYIKNFTRHTKYTRDTTALIKNFIEEKNQLLPDLFTAYTEGSKNQHKKLLSECTGKSLFIFDFWAIPHFQKQFFESLLNTATTSSWLIYYQKNNPHYEAAKPLFQWLKGLPIQTRHLPLPDSAAKANPVYQFHAKDMESELLAIAQKIQQLKAQNPQLKFNDMGLIFPNEPYFKTAKTIFSKHSIPTDIAQKKPLFRTIAGGLILDLLELETNQMAQKSLIKLASTPLFQMLDPQWLIRLAQDYLIENQASHWLSAIESKQKSLTPNVPEHTKAQTHAALITSLAQKLNRLTASETPVDYLENLIEIIQSYKIKDYIASLASDPALTDTIEFDQEIRLTETLLTTLTTLKKQWENPAISPASPEETKEAIRSLLYDTQIPFSNPASEKITCCGKFESFMIKKQILFICGATEGLWPATVPENLLCPNTIKHSLNWPNRATYYQWDQYLFLSATASAKHSCYISIPDTVEHTPTLASHFIPHEAGLDPQPAETAKKEPVAVQISKQNKAPTAPLLNQPEILQLLKNQCALFTYSASQLETYQTCPLKYFFQYLIKEPGIPEQSYDILPSLWGQAIHSLLQHYYEHIQTLPATEQNPVQLEKKLTEIANNYFAEKSKHPLWSAKIKILFDSEGKPGLIQRFITEESVLPTDLKPLALELEFNTKKIPNWPDKSIRLRGKIDGLFALPTQPDGVIIIDFKTGSSLPSGTDMLQCRKLQLPIYHLITEYLFSNKHILGSIIYQVHKPSSVEKKVMYVTPAGKTQLPIPAKKQPKTIPPDFSSTVLNHIKTLIGLIESGHLDLTAPNPVAELEPNRSQNACKFCPYHLGCRYEKRYAAY